MEEGCRLIFSISFHTSALIQVVGDCRYLYPGVYDESSGTVLIIDILLCKWEVAYESSYIISSLLVGKLGPNYLCCK